MNERSKKIGTGFSRAPPPAIELPDLPSDSGASTFFRSRQDVCELNTDFVDATSDLYRAQARQALAVDELVVARMRLAKTLSALQALPEVCLREQEHKLRVLVLKNEAEATEAAIILAEARGRLAQTVGGNKSVTVPTADAFTSDEIEDLLQALPEIAPETVQTLSLMLKGRAKEKRG